MNLRPIFNEFKSQVAFTLFLIWLLALRLAQDKLLAFALPLFAVLLMTTLDVVYTRLRFKKWYWPSASIVTGFLIGLIIAPTDQIWTVTAAVLAAFVSKQFIGAGLRQHIFNPAALGILTASLVFGTPVSWWAVAWSKWPLIILVPLMIRILWRMKRLWLPVGYLAVYLIYYLTLFDAKTATLALVDGSLLLFALVMLAEPITSPISGHFKYLFGVIVALIAIGFSLALKLPEVFLPALLLANLIGFITLRLHKKSAEVAMESKNRNSDQNSTVKDAQKGS